MSASDWPEAIASLPPLRAVIAEHDLAARKSLGQNFLLDLNVTDKIARAAGDISKTTVIEIGPGPGGLTRALLANGARHVLAVERDARFVQALQGLMTASSGRLTLLEADAMQVDVVAQTQRPRAVVANLPYNIGTELLLGWLYRAHEFQSLTLMFQKEVAQRIVAKHGGKEYGRLAVLAQATCAAKIAMNLPPNAFTPPPKVSSAVVHLVPLPQVHAPLDTLSRITAAAFGQRRKMVRSSLAPLFTEEVLATEGIDARMRAEEISVQQYCALARRL